LADASARVDLATAWGVDALPATPGRGTDEILAAAGRGDLKALVVGGIEVDDLADPVAALAGLDKASFVVSLEVRASAVTERADVVLPVAPMDQRSGSFVDWEGRVRPFERAIDSDALNDIRVLSGIADEYGRPLGLRTVADARAEMRELGPWDGQRAVFTPTPAPSGVPSPGEGELILSTWRTLIDDARAIDGEPHLAATARRPVAVLSEATLARLGVGPNDRVKVSTNVGSVTVPVLVGDIGDDIVWLPANNGGVSLHRDLRAWAGSIVRVERGSA
jgi:NADH-quinone oxidoreductase subunit G